MHLVQDGYTVTDHVIKLKLQTVTQALEHQNKLIVQCETGTEKLEKIIKQ